MRAFANVRSTCLRRSAGAALGTPHPATVLFLYLSLFLLSWPSSVTFSFFFSLLVRFFCRIVLFSNVIFKHEKICAGLLKIALDKPTEMGGRNTATNPEQVLQTRGPVFLHSLIFLCRTLFMIVCAAVRSGLWRVLYGRHVSDGPFAQGSFLFVMPIALPAAVHLFCFSSDLPGSRMPSCKSPPIPLLMLA